MKKIVFGLIAAAAVVVAFAATTPADTKPEGGCEAKATQAQAKADGCKGCKSKEAKADAACKSKEAKADAACKSKEAKADAACKSKEAKADAACKSKEAKADAARKTVEARVTVVRKSAETKAADCKGCKVVTVGAKAKTCADRPNDGMCCKSTAARPIAMGAKGCCNEPGLPAKFKVFADGKWMFYGSRGSAERGRRELLTKAFRVGQVLPVTGNARIPRNQSLI